MLKETETVVAFIISQHFFFLLLCWPKVCLTTQSPHLNLLVSLQSPLLVSLNYEVLKGRCYRILILLASRRVLILASCRVILASCQNRYWFY